MRDGMFIYHMFEIVNIIYYQEIFREISDLCQFNFLITAYWINYWMEISFKDSSLRL